MNSPQPNSTVRMIVWVLSILVVIATLALVFFAEFPIWGGLIITLVVLVPCQIYLSRTKPKK